MLSHLGIYLPEASAHASHVDTLFAAFGLLAAALTVPVFVAIIAFAIRYRRGKEVNREHGSDRNVWLEVSWSVIPFALILTFFVVAASLFFDLHTPPADAATVNVVARQWMWKFQHAGGQAEINELHAPAGQSVRLIMTSQDVIHSLYIPALRIKQDVLPGRYTQLWFAATRPGTYHLFCAEYCGTDHAVMGGRFVVMSPRDFASWLAKGASSGSLAMQGGVLYRRLGCGACHEGGAVAAPRLAGLYESMVTLEDGNRVRADEQYLHDAIMLPNAQRTAGYRPIMPSYRGLIGEDDALKLVAYLRNLGQEPETPQ